MPYPLIAILIGLLVAVPLVHAARRVGLSYPIVLLSIGLVLGFIPGTPSVHLDPNLVLLIFLPPLLFWEAVTSPTDVMLANPGQIAMLAIGLVIATTIAVAVAVHAIVPSLPWAVAFVLGAIVAPTDELASVPVLERFKIPRHLVAIVEGESLVNDALSLVLYAAAVSAAVTGTFDFKRDLVYVFVAAVGAFIVGFVASRAAVEGWRRIVDSQLQGVISVLLPFVVYVPAQLLGLSGVIGVVTAGVYSSRFSPEVITPQTRLQGIAFWESFVFLSNAVLFLLVGLQLREIATVVFAHYPWPMVLWYAFAVNVIVIAVRFAWIVGTEYLPFIGGSSEHSEPNVKHAIVASWSGLRGAVSLAAALAIPATLAGGGPFPFRDLIIFLTFTVIVVTLIGGGVTLPSLIRFLKLSEERDEEAEDLRRALAGVSAAALARVDVLEKEGRLNHDNAAALRKRFERKKRLAEHREDPSEIEEQIQNDAEREVILAERQALITMRRNGEIDNAVQRLVQSRLDIAEEHIARLK